MRTPEFVPIESAGRLAGIPPRTLRSWVDSGKLPAIAGQRGRLVDVGEVRRIAEVTGRMSVSAWQDAGKMGMSARSAVSHAVEAAGEQEAAETRLAAIRDEWLMPLVAEVRGLSAEVGRVTAERDALRRQLERMTAASVDVAPHGAEAAAPAPGAAPSFIAAVLRRLLRRDPP